MDQHPVAGPDPVEQADVDGAPHARDVDPREPVRLVDELHDLAGDRQAHGPPGSMTERHFGARARLISNVAFQPAERG